MRKTVIIMMYLLAAVMAKAQSGLNITPLFEGKIIPQERMVETRVKGKMLSKYQLSRVHALVGLDQKTHPGHAYAENYSNQKSHSKETLMIQLPKVGRQNRFLCYKRKGDEITVVYMEGTLNSVYALKEIIK